MSFDALLSLASTKVAIDAIYYVTRLIRHRYGLAGSGPKLLAEGLTNEPSLEAAQLAQRVVKVIERETKSPLPKISPEAAAQVVDQLEQLALARYSEGLAIDTARGEALLQELRDSSQL